MYTEHVKVLECGCVPDASGYGYCEKCEKALHTKIWKNMSEDRKKYDRMVDPSGSAQLDEWGKEECCSCHINPPCSYCVEQGEENA